MTHQRNKKSGRWCAVLAFLKLLHSAYVTVALVVHNAHVNHLYVCGTTHCSPLGEWIELKPFSSVFWYNRVHPNAATRPHVLSHAERKTAPQSEFRAYNVTIGRHSAAFQTRNGASERMESREKKWMKIKQMKCSWHEVFSLQTNVNCICVRFDSVAYRFKFIYRSINQNNSGPVAKGRCLATKIQIRKRWNDEFIYAIIRCTIQNFQQWRNSRSMRAHSCRDKILDVFFLFVFCDQTTETERKKKCIRLIWSAHTLCLTFHGSTRWCSARTNNPNLFYSALNKIWHKREFKFDSTHIINVDRWSFALVVVVS